MKRRRRQTSLEHCEGLVRRGRTSMPTAQVAVAFLHGEYGIDGANPYYWLHRETRAEVDSLMMYQARLDVDRWRARSEPYRRAAKLLREFLNSHQRAQIARRGYFLVEAPSGGATYRVWARTGSVERVSLHGKRYYPEVFYCHHDQPQVLPPADVALAHLLMLQGDEERFLAETEGHSRPSDLWDGEHNRQMREARRQRQEGMAELWGAARSQMFVCHIDEDVA